jgi:AraC-like DNA-binding protein
VEFVESAHARFHFVLSGACHVSVGGEVFELHALDLLLLPGGQRHVVYDGKTQLTRDLQAVSAEIRQGRNRDKEAVASVGLVSGHFEFDREARGLLSRALPPVLRGSARQHLDNGLMAVLPEVLAQELRQSRPGAETIVARLAEVFLVQVLRAHFERVGSGNSLLSAMFEPRLNAGLCLMHACWNEPLPLARIAAAAGMSRSSFAERFKSVTGTSPMSYLAHWRLLKSRRLLADRELSIARIATLCGHRSTEGYSRAFKRAFGLSPAKWRATNETVSHAPLVP